MRSYLPKPALAVIAIVLIIGSIVWLQSQKASTSNTVTGDTAIDVAAVARENRAQDAAGSDMSDAAEEPLMGGTEAAADNTLSESEATEPVMIAQEPEVDVSPEPAENVTCDRPAQKIINPSGYVNTNDEPITIEEFIGRKVILVDFLTYSCINCQRTFPYLNAWHEKYNDAGLQIIGIHTPEFEFEKEIENVEMAAKKFGLTYPLVLDNNRGTWHAYQNRYWPRKYIIDINGCIAYDHIGEGGYTESENEIQELLAERNQVLGITTPVPSGIVDPDAKVGSFGVRTPEIYFGSWRNDEYIGNGVPGEGGEDNFDMPSTLLPDKFYLDGKWNIHREYAEALEAGASVSLEYKAKDVYAVLAAPEGATVTVYQDGIEVKTITVQEDELYILIENDAVEEHTLRFETDRPGLQAFTFTFG